MDIGSQFAGQLLQEGIDGAGVDGRGDKS